MSEFNETLQKEVVSALTSHSIPVLTSSHGESEISDGIGLGTGVCILYKAEISVLTAAHVVPDGVQALQCPKLVKLSRDEINSMGMETVVETLAICPDKDVALISQDVLNEEWGVQPYKFEKSDCLSHELVSQYVAKGATVYIFGWPALKDLGPIAEVHSDHNGNKGTFISPASYFAKGTLAEVSEDKVIGHFPENIEAFKNEKEFSQLRDAEINPGGSRNLKGMSGCGIWVHTTEGVLLLGTLSGPKEGVGDPLMRFLPVWRIKQWMDENAITRQGES